MNEYVVCLSLAYFLQKGEDYVISELMELLGYSRIQISELISWIVENDYIAYDNDLLRVTRKGFRFLISRDKTEIIIRKKTMGPLYIKEGTAQPLDVPYVPENFTKKY